MEENNEMNVEEKKGMSIASMVLGIVGVMILPLICGILAIIFSVIGKKKGGKGFATAGLVLGIIDTSYGVISLIVTLAAIGSILA